jgi:hypothetical protein
VELTEEGGSVEGKSDEGPSRRASQLSLYCVGSTLLVLGVAVRCQAVGLALELVAPMGESSR